jgi:hypothetical protein
MRSAAVLVLVISIAGVARAQDASSAVAQPTAQDPVAVPPPAADPTLSPPGLTPARPIAERKNPNTALAISLLTTLGGYGMLFLGESMANQGTTGAGWLAFTGATLTLVGPTLCHTYAGKTWNTGLAVRIVGLGVVSTAFVVALSCSDGCNDNGSTTVDAALALALAGSITYVVGTIYEIATARDAAVRYNRQHGLDATLTVAPIATRDGITPGMAVVGRF